MNNEGYIAQLTTNGQHDWAVVQVRLQDLESPAQAASFDMAYWQTHDKQTINRKSLVIGHRNDFTAVSVVAREVKKPTRFEKHVYFGYKHKIYSLILAFHEQDFNELSPDFDTMLSTVEIIHI